jgi:hypothetical protein
MKQVLLNIPEAYTQQLLQYINNIPDAFVVNQSDFLINENMLDKSSNTSIENCLTKETSNIQLKSKYCL